MLRSALLAFAGLALAASPTLARTWYINPEGTGDAPTIQAAMSFASSGDIILLDCGTYYEHDIGMRSGIRLQSVTGLPDCAVVDAQGYEFGLACYSLDDTTTIEGITIRGASRCGLGMSYSFPTVRNCSFSNNDNTAINGAGAGVNCLFSDPSFHDCTFADNTAAAGGGLFGWESRVVLDHCTFERNRAVGGPGTNSAGGGALFHYSTVTVNDCDFTSNEADSAGAAFLVWWSSLDTEDCTFTDNVAQNSEGGALRLLYSAIALRRCDFTGNEAPSGGGVGTVGCWAEIDSCSFSSNVANTTSGYGGGFYDWQSTLRMRDCSFVGNIAWRGGGARLGATWSMDGEGMTRCVFSGNRHGVSISSTSGLLIDRCLFEGNTVAALVSHDSSPIVTNSTFHGNTPDGNGAIVSINGSAVTLDHCIVAFNSPGPAVSCDLTGSAELTCCDVYGNTDGDWAGCIAGQASINGNFSADPLFCNPAAGDFTIQSDSPCAPPGVTGCGLVGALPVDCGPSSIELSSWGKIKAMYRSAE